MVVTWSLHGGRQKTAKGVGRKLPKGVGRKLPQNKDATRIRTHKARRNTLRVLPRGFASLRETKRRVYCLARAIPGHHPSSFIAPIPSTQPWPLRQPGTLMIDDHLEPILDAARLLPSRIKVESITVPGGHRTAWEVALLDTIAGRRRVVTIKPDVNPAGDLAELPRAAAEALTRRSAERVPARGQSQNQESIFPEEPHECRNPNRSHCRKRRPSSQTRPRSRTRPPGHTRYHPKSLRSWPS